VPTGLQIRQNLSLVNWPKLLHSLHFDDHAALHQEVQPIFRHGFAAILHVDPTLALKTQTAITQFDSHGAVVDPLDESRPKLPVNSQPGSDNLTNDPFDVRTNERMRLVFVALVIFVVHTSSRFP